MTPGAEMTFAVIAAGVSLSGLAAVLIRLFSWAITRLIRDEITPIVKDFAKASADLGEKMAVMTAHYQASQKSYEASQKSQDRGNEEMHNAVDAIRERLDEHGEKIAEHTTAIAVLQRHTGGSH